MGELTMILYGVTVVLSLCLVFVIVKNRQIHKNIDMLTKSVENFIQNNNQTELSTNDSHFASLQNAVAELEERYCLERNNIEKTSKENKEFIIDVSHQLKTPLAAMKLYVELENANSPNEHTKKELELIEKMENLIYKLLRLEKIKSDSYTMDFKLESVAELANEIVNEFKPVFPDKKYTVIGDSKLRIDKLWMYEAIANVVKNACEHTDKDGKIEIVIDDSEKATNIFIKDNGKGVSRKDLPKLFSRFHRAENASQNSSGIGLAITKAIIEKHHGTIVAENGKEGLNIIICIPHIDGYITI